MQYIGSVLEYAVKVNSYLTGSLDGSSGDCRSTQRSVDRRLALGAANNAAAGILTRYRLEYL